MTTFGLLRPPPEFARLGLRAMKTVATADGDFPKGARSLLGAAQHMLLGTNEDLELLETIEPNAFAQAFPLPELRSQIAKGMVVLTLVSGKPKPSVTEKARAFARALGVDEPAMETVTKLAEGHLLLGSLDWLRRSHLRDIARVEFEPGLLHGVKTLLGVRGFVEDKLVAEPFLALADLPTTTFGRALFDHYRANGFAFPGEKHGFPEAGVHHDLAHVLSGYGTDPYGELQVAAFTAGFRKKDPLFVAMLPLLLFCADINVTPIPHDHVDEFFSKPGAAESFFAAIERGAKVKVDLTDRWDFWPLLRRPLVEVRALLGVD